MVIKLLLWEILIRVYSSSRNTQEVEKSETGFRCCFIEWRLILSSANMFTADVPVKNVYTVYETVKNYIIG